MVLLPLEGNLVSEPFFEKRAGPKGGGRLVLVGNSRMDVDRSRFVDSAHCVMRFSRITHFDTGLTGTKTDILAIRSSRAFTRNESTPIVHDPTKMERYVTSIGNLKPWHDCEEMWICGQWLNYEIDIEPYVRYFPKMVEKQIRLIHINPLYQYVFGLDKSGYLTPLTSGIVMVLYLLSIRYLRAWKIQLVGFRHFDDVEACHEIEKDKQVLRGLEKAGYIELRD